MGRKKDNVSIYDDVDFVLAQITDQQKITWDDLFYVAEEWCKKDYEHHVEFAKKHNMIPIALLLISLLYVEHPLLVAPGRGWIYEFSEAAAVILMAQIEEADLPIPVRKIKADSFHSPVVEKIG